ncbi:hypothetical protein [Magnetospira sp. QH-2]|uniref:hypothetical protein n=1 Tax=Magnetospira sp. (strain QH-2) TaxID=1288970 RepID=UPI0003E80D6E|nr:hypothetical protein [Magnetospira sp. QH-2]CCQ73950.1 Protein of unknown function [Magnetospira sp. QH-2]
MMMGQHPIHTIRLLCLGLLGITLAACETSDVSDKFVAQSAQDRPQSVVISAAMARESGAVDPYLFGQLMVDHLKVCGIAGGFRLNEITYKSTNPSMGGLLSLLLGLDRMYREPWIPVSDQQALEAVRDYPAQGVLLVTETMSHQLRKAGGTEDVSREYRIRYVDRRSGETLWGANLSNRGSLGWVLSPEEKAINLSRSIMEPLARDGILSGCLPRPVE